MTAQPLPGRHCRVGVVVAAAALALQSVVFAAEQTMPPGRPDKPFVSVDGNTVTILVSPPASGGPPNHYILRAYQGSNLAPLAQIDIGATLRFTTSAPDGVYVVTIAAVNEAGSSAPSPPNAVLVGSDRVEFAPTGTGTPGTLTRWLTATRLGDSAIVEEGANVGIGTAASPAGARLQVQSNLTDGVVGTTLAATGRGLVGQSPWIGVFGTSSVSGVQGETDRGNGVLAIATGPGNALRAEARGTGWAGAFQGNVFVTGALSSSSLSVVNPESGVAVFAQSPLIGVLGVSQGSAGVQGETQSGNAVFGISNGPGSAVRGEGRSTGLAGSFVGNVHVAGNLHVQGTLSKAGGTFLIDHPLDPQNKVLRHAFVESPEMKNVYDGTAVLGEAGAVEISLPPYFDALNTDVRYQLTPIGEFAPLFVAKEVSDGRFTIGGGRSGLKVSWQVTGVRRDPWALANPIAVEELKPTSQRGAYVNPEAFAPLEARTSPLKPQ